MQMKLLKVFVLGLVFTSVSCLPLPHHIDPASPSQIPTAEYLLANQFQRNLVTFIYPSPGSVFEPGYLSITAGFSHNTFLQMGFDEEDYETTVRRGKLEVNQESLIEMGCCYEQFAAQFLTEPIWDLVAVWGGITVSEGLYMVTYSVELPDGSIHSESWAYRVERNRNQ